MLKVHIVRGMPTAGRFYLVLGLPPHLLLLCKIFYSTVCNWISLLFLSSNIKTVHILQVQNIYSLALPIGFCNDKYSNLGLKYGSLGLY